MSKRGRPKHPDILTPREWEVLELIREGLSNVEIGSRLGISIDGVKYHVTEILGKLELENRHQAAAWTPDQRPWWESAGVLLSVPRPRVDWLSPAVGGALAVVIAVAVGLLVWALLATSGGGPSTPAVALPAGDRLAYVDVGEDLWMLEGTERQRITSDGSASNPRWSPDGQTLLFSHDGTLTLRDADGRLVPIDGGVVTAHWSPDSRRIAYRLETRTSGPDGEVRISTVGGVRVYDIERGERERVVPADFEVIGLAWSPDGRQLALARFIQPEFLETGEDTALTKRTVEGKTEPSVRLSSDSTLWLLTLDESGANRLRRVLPREAVVDALPEPFNDESSLGLTGVGSPSWSPDGEWIGFWPTTLSASAPNDGLPYLTVRRDGSNIMSHGTMPGLSTLRDWSSNGHTLAVTLGGGRDVTLGKTIAIVEPGVPGALRVGEEQDRYDRLRGSATGVTPTPYSARSDSEPAWSPDGERLVFQASEAGQTVVTGKIESPREGIWTINADGSGIRQLTSDPEYLDFSPHWSADGELIMFVRTASAPVLDEQGTPAADPKAELWLMRADGSGAVPLNTELQRVRRFYGLVVWDAAVAWWRQ